MSSRLRSHSKIEHVGIETSELLGARLPTTKEVVCYFYFLHRTEGLTVRESARKAVREATAKFWSKTSIPIVQEIRGIEKIEEIFKEVEGLKKSKNRNQDDAVEKIQKKLGTLFDMSKKGAVALMQKAAEKERDLKRRAALEEEIQFLEDQRNVEKRQSSISGIDRNLAQDDKKKQEKLERKKERENALAERQKRSQSKAEDDRVLAGAGGSFDDHVLDSVANDADFQPVLRQEAKKKIDVMTPEVAQALDAAKVSSYQATVILAAAANAFGVDLADTNISRTTIQAKRTKIRNERAAKIRGDYRPDEVLTLHWDGKIVSTLTGRESVDRQAIVVKGATTGETQLLGAPPLEHGRGIDIAEAVANHVNEWQVASNCKTMCFDTTSVNSGWKNGAATLLEKILEKEMLWFPCRHHILEILVGEVYHVIMGMSTGPEVLLFKRFQKCWKDIDQKSFDIPSEYPSILDDSRRREIISFAQKQIDVGQPRDDYLELLELSILILGGSPLRGIRWRPPGPIHHARWMAKGIYSLKMSLFRTQLQAVMTQEEAEALLKVSFFVVSTYLEAWFAAPFPASAARSELQLVKNIDRFRSVHAKATAAAEKKICDHLWYLSEENIGLALFDEALPATERAGLAHSIQHKIGAEDPMKKRVMPFQQLKVTPISDLGTVKTASFFKILGFDDDFVSHPVESWSENPNYRRCKQVVDGLNVVNDHAERSIKLIQDYNRLLTTKEAAFQNILLTVAEHKKTLPNVKKSTLAKKYSK